MSMSEESQVSVMNHGVSEVAEVAEVAEVTNVTEKNHVATSKGNLLIAKIFRI
jgi:hypothetical protein